MNRDEGGAYASATFPLGIPSTPPPIRESKVGLTPTPAPLYLPRAVAVAQSQMTDFICFCEETTGWRFEDAAAFHRFSVQDYRLFWRLFLEWSELEV